MTVAAVFAVTVSAQQPEWKNLDVFSVNAETERTELIFWSDAKDAMTGRFTESENYMDLGGTWKFQYYDTQQTGQCLTVLRRLLPGLPLHGMTYVSRATGRCRASVFQSMSIPISNLPL